MAEQVHNRVTEILSPFTGVEFVPKSILEPARDRGIKVHKYIEGILSGWEFHVEQENIKPYIDSFHLFWEKSKHAFENGKLILEKRLFCDDLMITGQVDVLVESEDRTYLIDWKTSAGFHKSWYLQGAAYKYLCKKNGYKDVDDVLFVKLDKQGKQPSIYKSSEYEEHIDIFNKCLELYKWFDMGKTRKQWNQ